MALNELKYNFRSMDDVQKCERVEVLINTKDILEIMNKYYLWNPIAIEIFDIKHNRMYFFNLFQEDIRNRFVNIMERYIGIQKIIINPKEEFQERKYSINWSNSSNFY